MRRPLALCLACLATLGCDAFGDVVPPAESAGAGGQGGGASGAGAGTGSNGTFGSGTLSSGTWPAVSVSSGGQCSIGDRPSACMDCLEAFCCALLPGAVIEEPTATAALTSCLDGPGCACANGLNVCYLDFEEAIGIGAAQALGFSSCARSACEAACDCCAD